VKTSSVVLAAALVICGVHGASSAEEPRTIVIRGEEYPVWPAENLVRRGFDVAHIPNEKNAAWVYLEAFNAYNNPPPTAGRALDYATGTAWPVGSEAFAIYMSDPDTVRALRLYREASEMKRCQFPYFGDPSTSVVSVLMPTLAPMRFLSKLVVAEGRKLEAEGDYAGAFDRYLSAMRAGEHAAKGATLIEGLVGLAVWALADHALDDLVLRHPIPVKELERWQTLLDPRAARLPSPQRGLEGERSFGPAIVDEICSHPLQLFTTGRLFREDAIWDGGIRPGEDDGWGRLEARIGRLFFPDRAIKRHMNGYYDRVFERAAGGSLAWTAVPDEDERYIKEQIPQWDVLSRSMLPSLYRVTVLGLRGKADLALTRTLIALRIHALRHDAMFPAALEELGEAFVTKHAMDPFYDGPLGYRRTGDGFVLYSVGPEGVDDGGAIDGRWDELDFGYMYPPQPIKAFSANGGDQ